MTENAHDILCPYFNTDFLRGSPIGCQCSIIFAVRRNERARLVEAWKINSHAVMFNKAKDDLTPAQRVTKWLREWSPPGE